MNNNYTAAVLTDPDVSVWHQATVQPLVWTEELKICCYSEVFGCSVCMYTGVSVLSMKLITSPHGVNWNFFAQVWLMHLKIKHGA